MPRPGIVITCYNEGRAGWRERDGVMQYEDALSEKYEGNELLATLDSARDGVPIVVVDDGSTDGCAARCTEFGASLVTHKERIGIGYSRTEGVEALPSDCDCVMFLDAHMRLSPGCLQHCADLALKHNAVVWPDTRGLRDRPRYKRYPKRGPWTGHGAIPRTKPAKDEPDFLFRYRWQNNPPVDKLSRTHALISPGYCIPRSLWEQIKITKLARGFGANEPMIWVKCFFLGIPVLHTCGAMVRHLFRSGTAHYTVPSSEVYRNMALLAKTCFDRKTWDAWWYPAVFDGKLDQSALDALNSDELMDEHYLFQSRKKRPDSEFWRGLCFEDVPDRRIE